MRRSYILAFLIVSVICGQLLHHTFYFFKLTIYKLSPLATPPPHQHHTLVVAICGEDVAWVDRWAPYFTEVIVYSKCSQSPVFESGDIVVKQQANVGGCDMTYLQYIIDHYNSLPDKVTFVKGTLCSKDRWWLHSCHRIFDGDSTRPLEPTCQSTRADVEEMMQFSLSDYYPRSNRDQGHPFTKSEYANMGEWVDQATLLTRQIFESARAEPIYGGYFTASRAHILNAPRSVYVNLREQQTAPNEEVDHFIERSWSTLFCAPSDIMKQGVAMKEAVFRLKQWQGITTDMSPLWSLSG